MVETKLVIPTIRLRDVAKTVIAYRENLSRYGHDIPIIVFDDSDLTTFEQDFSVFNEQRPRNTLYCGTHEKASFIEQLVAREGLESEPIIRRILRPSYGGNRNFTVLYTLGDFFLSVDDDMRPWGLLNKKQVTLRGNEVLKGEYVDKTDPKKVIEKRDYDILGAYLDVLGKHLERIGTGSYLIGSNLIDTMTDLYTNKTIDGLKSNTVSIVEGQMDKNTRIITAQSFRSGSADVDAIDYVDDFLVNPHNAFVNDMSLCYTLNAFRPCITKNNWRMDCGISGYDNSEGLPPFFPTRLRFEDYGFRIWLQHKNLAAAHVRAVQTHYRNPYRRESLGHDFWNEEMANFLKPKLKERVTRIYDTSIIFEGEIHVTKDEAKQIMEKGRKCFKSAISQAAKVLEERIEISPLTSEQAADYLIGFARDISDEFSGFDINQFHSRMQATLQEELTAIQSTMSIWPRLLEIAYDLKQPDQSIIRRVL